MPNFDGMGPAGQGARTGRGSGTCVGNDFGGGVGCRGRKCGAGRGMRGGGMGMSLDDQEKQLQQQLDRVREAKKNTEKEV